MADDKIAVDAVIRADNYVDEAERDGTKANDEGRGVKLESDGYLSPAFIRNASVKAILTSDYQLDDVDIDAIVDWDDSDFNNESMLKTGNDGIYEITSTSDNEFTSTTTDWLAESFTTGASDVLIKKIRLRLYNAGGTSTDTISIKIRSAIDGADLWEETGIEVSATGGADINVYPNLGCDPSTQYFVIVAPTTNDGMGWFHDNGGNGEAAESGYTSSDSGANWSALNSGNSDFNMTVDTGGAILIPKTGTYLIIANIDSGVAVDKTIKIKKATSAVEATLLEKIADSDGTVESGASLTTMAELTAGDVVYVTVNQASSAADDILQEGSSLEAIIMR